MRLPYDEDIKDFETRITDGLLKGIARRLGHGYEYCRQRLRNTEKASWYEKFFQFWLAVDAEDQSAADAYFYDFQARRAALRDEHPDTEERELIAETLKTTAAGIDAAIHKDVQRMKREIPEAIAKFEELLANAQREAKG